MPVLQWITTLFSFGISAKRASSWLCGSWSAPMRTLSTRLLAHVDDQDPSGRVSAIFLKSSMVICRA